MEQQRLQLYTIDMKYVRNLAKKDTNVMSVSPQIDKSIRPFVGILVLLNQRSYCIPLTSPKEKFEGKKNSVDFIKILHSSKKNENGAFKVIGALNLNNMLPVDARVLTPVDLNIYPFDNGSVKAQKHLMKDQLSWCQANQDIILKRANQLYKLVSEHPEQNRQLVRRCCNFKKLEKVLDNYIDRSEHPEKYPVQKDNQPIYPLSRKQLAQNTKTIKGKETSNSKDKSVHKKKNKPNLE